MKIHEHNATTGEIIEREATAAELAKAIASEEATKARQLEESAKVAEKSALLERLGITEDEAKLLLG
jgi:hypothetical protein